MESTASEFYEALVTALVAPMLERPDDLDVVINRRGNSLSIACGVHPSETGRVVGTRGETVRALRAVVDFAAARRADRVVLDVRDA
jgi:predicted RNA-binding protein YlqC (UPF0109 family)